MFTSGQTLNVKILTHCHHTLFLFTFTHTQILKGAYSILNWTTSICVCAVCEAQRELHTQICYTPSNLQPPDKHTPVIPVESNIHVPLKNNHNSFIYWKRNTSNNNDIQLCMTILCKHIGMKAGLPSLGSKKCETQPFMWHLTTRHRCPNHCRALSLCWLSSFSFSFSRQQC